MRVQAEHKNQDYTNYAENPADGVVALARWAARVYGLDPVQFGLELSRRMTSRDMLDGNMTVVQTGIINTVGHYIANENQPLRSLRLSSVYKVEEVPLYRGMVLSLEDEKIVIQSNPPFLVRWLRWKYGI